MTRLACFLLACFLCSPSAWASNTSHLVSEKVDQVFQRLEKGETPESIFHISFGELAMGEGRVTWLEPEKWIPNADSKKLKGYIGTLAYGRFDAPFYRAFQIVTAYVDAPKFIPGVLSTEILERTREAKDKETVVIERARELPVALRALSGYDNHYRLRYEIRFEEGEWVLIRIKLEDGDRHWWEGRPISKEIEAIEYVKRLEDHHLIYVSFGFALPNTGVLPVQKPPEQRVPGLLNSVTLGVADKVAAKLDVGGQLFGAIADSILDGTYQTMFSLMQVTTDPRWNTKWPHQFSLQETNEIFRENNAALAEARQKGLITYPNF